MKDRVQYFSPYDLSVSFELKEADAVVEKYRAGWRPADVNDVLELYNIWLFVENGVYYQNWSPDVLSFIRGEFKDEVTHYFATLKRDTWVAVFRQVDAEYKHCFWEILDRFNYDGLLDLTTLREALFETSWGLCDLLHQERLVGKNQQAIKSLLKENEHAVEWMLQEYVEENKANDHGRLFFPKALTNKEKEEIISRYLDTDEPNLNYVRLIRVARKDANLRLSDEVRLKAINVEKRLNAIHFPADSVIRHRYGVIISSASGKPLKWVKQDENGDLILCYSRQIMQLFKGPEILHYIRYGFEFLTPGGLISLISKESDAGSFECVFSMRGRYSYPTNFAFQYKEGISLFQIESMQNVLRDDGTSIESSLKVFYEQYLKEQYGYPSGILSLASESADWLTKCKAIVPEIDAIAHRYNQYVQRGEVDEDLLLMSSDNVRVTEVESVNPERYYAIDGQSGELLHLFSLLFSDQSMLTFVEPYKDDRYKSLYQLLVNQDGRINYDNYQPYQLNNIDYLIKEGYLSKDTDGNLHVEKLAEINLLKILYEYHACPACCYDQVEAESLQDMERKGWIKKDNHLLTFEERNYFDYYLYNTKYTNGPALRNHYAHGSHANASKENVHHCAYNRLLILLILELLKIEDDLAVHKEPGLIHDSRHNLS